MKKLLIVCSLMLSVCSYATNFVFYSYGKTNTAQAVLADGRQCAVTLPETLTTNDMVLMWVSNSSGYSTPVAINKTEAWWVGPDAVATGETFSVYGRNLKRGSGSTYLYVEPDGIWLTNSVNNPYKADFVAVGLTNGTKTIWAHNGKGGDYGWGDSLTLTVEAAPAWDDDPDTWIDVKEDYGAVGDGSADDSAEIASAFSAAGENDTVYFTNGVYALGTRISEIGSHVRVLGAGADVTTITDHSSTTNNGQPLFQDWRASYHDIEYRDIAFSHGTYHTNGPLFSLSDQSGMSFYNCVFDQRNIALTSKNANALLVKGGGSENAFFSNCTFYGSTEISFAQATANRFVDCDFYALNDNGWLFNISGSDGFSFERCTAQHYDASDVDDGHGWGKGRFILGSGDYEGGTRNFYYGDCETINFGASRPAKDQNAGEDILFEFSDTRFRDSPSSVTSTSVTFSALSTDWTTDIIAVVGGKGIGQSRRINNYSSGTVIVDDWNVVPDTNSVLTIGSYQTRMVVYNSVFDGDTNNITTPDYASTGVQPYGATFDWVVDGNTFTDSSEGIAVWGMYDDHADEVDEIQLAQPNYFNLFVDNVISNCGRGIETVIVCFDRPALNYDLVLLGNTYRGNNTYDISSVDHMVRDTIHVDHMGDEIGMALGVLDGNSATDLNVFYSDEGNITNTVFINNTTNGASWNP